MTGRCLRMKPALFTLLLAACGSPTESQGPPAAQRTVVVYATGAHDAGFEALFSSYTTATGTAVVVRQAAAAQVAAAAADGTVDPPVDVVFASGISGAFIAADEGALRPLDSKGAVPDVPDWARDPDGFWTGIAYRYAALLYHANVDDVPRSDDFRALAEPGLGGQLCLTAYEESMNSVIVANLIDRLGERAAELTVRGWLQNLAAQPFATERELVAAVETGTCPLGIAASTAFERAGTGLALPARAHVDVAVVGIGRHAANPTAAADLVTWMLGPEFQQAYAAFSGAYPLRAAAGEVSGADFQAHGMTDVDNVARIARRLEEARRLAERAGWR